MAGTLTPWPTLPPQVYRARPGSLPFPFGGGRHLATHARARSGLASGLLSLGVGAGRSVLMPAWHHGSEVEAVLSTGARCVFYDVGPDGSPSLEHLEPLVTPEVAALHLTHLLGFPQDAATWRAWCDARGLLLIEDAAQAWTASHSGTPVGSHGDLAAWCLYKTVGVPDGAVIRSTALPPAPARGSRAGALRRTARRHAAWAAQRIPVGGRRPPAEYDAAADMAMTPPLAWSEVTRWALPRFDYDLVGATRRSHFKAWAQVLPAANGFASLPQGAVPMVFPVAVDDKEAALAELRALGIVALDFWREPHPSVARGAFPSVDEWRAHLVGLPVHQEIGERRLQRAIDTVAPVLLRRTRPSS